MPMEGREQWMIEAFKEEQSHARHTETQRLEVTKFILAAIAALLGVMGALKFSVYAAPLAVAVIFLGRLGRRLTEVYVNRFDDHRDRARALRAEIDSAVGGKVQQILHLHRIDKSQGSVREFWNRLHTAVMIFGVLCLVWIVGSACWLACHHRA
jgi:uncharacterized protein (DUF2126 family)